MHSHLLCDTYFHIYFNKLSRFPFSCAAATARIRAAIEGDKMFKRSWRSGVSLAVLLSAVAATPVLAQQVTSEARGEVRSAEGAPVVGAKVTILHVPSNTVTTVKTNGAGVFSARNLRPGGPYKITVEKQGFEIAESENVFISLNDSYRTSFTLAAVGAQAPNEVVVSAQRENIYTQGPLTVLNRREVDNVASINRDVRDVLRRDPLATQNSVGNGGISIAGQLPQANRITIDGVSAKDDFGINTGGLPTSRGPVSLDAIGEVSINKAPFDVEEGNLLGGAVNIVLKSGANKLEGTGFWETNRNFLAGSRVADRPVTTDFSGRTFGGVVSGPIIRDKLFFSGSYEDFNRLSTTGVGPQGANPPFVTERNISQEQFDAVSDLVRSLYRYEPLGIIRTSPVLDRKWHARLDWNITDKHRAQFTYRSARDSQINRPTPAGVSNALTDSSYFYNLREVDTSYTGQVSSDWSNAFSTEFRVVYRKYDRTQDPLGPNDNAEGTAESDALEFPEVLICADATSSGSTVACTNNVPTLAFGPDRFRQANILRTNTLTLRAKGEYLVDAHRIKFGFERQANTDSNLIVPNSEGIYYFDSIADFAAGRANQLTYSNSLDGIARNASADFNFEYNTAFLQDSWDVNSWLTLGLGLRYDFYTSNSGPRRSDPFVQRYAAQGRVNDAFIGGRDIFEPRFTFDIRPDQRTRITGGVGLFSSLISDVLALSGSVANDGVRTNTIQINRSGAGFALNQGTPSLFNNAIGASALNIFARNTPYDLFLIPDDVQSFLAGGGAPTTASTVSIDPNFKAPSNWKGEFSINRTVDAGILGDNWRLGFDFLYQLTQNAYDITDLRLVPNGLLPDGRQRYIGDNNATPALDRALTGVGDSGFDILFRNTKRGNARAFTWTVAKSFPFLDVNFSYARQDANSVIDGQVGGTTGQSQYSGTAVLDPNVQALGTSAQEIKNSLKYEFSFHKKFYKNYETRITLFGERRSGRPYSYTFGDQSATGNTTRSQVFGALGTSRFLFYVPDFTNDANPDDLQVGSVFFDTAASRDTLRDFVVNGQLAQYQGQIVPRNIFRSPAINVVDLTFRQELPFAFGHKPEIYIGIQNILNLINRNWGVAREFGSQIRLVNVACATATGQTGTAANVACTNYQYSGVNINPNPNNTDADTPGIDIGSSRWTAAIGLRYKF